MGLNKNNIYEINDQEDNPFLPNTGSFALLNSTLLDISEDGVLLVKLPNGIELSCAWLEREIKSRIKLERGDQVLVVQLCEGKSGLVLGRIGRYCEPQLEDHIIIEASETLTLKCGEASVELRKDGKAMVKGEDVLLRAKGTQRIRAGTVAIN